MSNNSDTTRLLPAATEEDQISKDFLLKHMINRSILESSTDEEEDEDKENKEITVEVSPGKKKLMIKMPTLVGDHRHQFNDAAASVLDEDDEGFRTPTSSDKKIPVMISPKCPPPPRKPKSSISSLSMSPTTTTTPPPNYKRKTPPSSSPSSKMNLPYCRCRCRIRISDEDIKALFPPTFLADLGRKIKKARSTGFN